MKKIVLTLFLAVCCLAANMAHAQFNFHAGYIQNTITTSNTILGVTHTDTTTHPGFFAGFGCRMKLLGPIGLSIGLNGEYYQGSQKATYLNFTGVDAKYRQIDVTVPLQLSVALRLSNTSNFTLFGGPNIYFGVINTTDYHYFAGPLEHNTTVNNFQTDDATSSDFYMERFGLSATFGFGLNFDQVGFHGGYTFTLTNMAGGTSALGSSSRLFVGLNINM
ncbi:MAG: outer membrane beta-barrel protein [Bacteroidales bacterium]|nr:outer membrane beta-barrel protein [Bacteroidales bacterium]